MVIGERGLPDGMVRMTGTGTGTGTTNFRLESAVLPVPVTRRRELKLVAINLGHDHMAADSAQPLTHLVQHLLPIVDADNGPA